MCIKNCVLVFFHRSGNTDSGASRRGTTADDASDVLSPRWALTGSFGSSQDPSDPPPGYPISCLSTEELAYLGISRPANPAYTLLYGEVPQELPRELPKQTYRAASTAHSVAPTGRSVATSRYEAGHGNYGMPGAFPRDRYEGSSVRDTPAHSRLSGRSSRPYSAAAGTQSTRRTSGTHSTDFYGDWSTEESGYQSFLSARSGSTPYYAAAGTDRSSRRSMDARSIDSCASWSTRQTIAPTVVTTASEARAARKDSRMRKWLR